MPLQEYISDRRIVRKQLAFPVGGEETRVIIPPPPPPWGIKEIYEVELFDDDYAAGAILDWGQIPSGQQTLDGELTNDGQIVALASINNVYILRVNHNGEWAILKTLQPGDIVYPTWGKRFNNMLLPVMDTTSYKSGVIKNINDATAYRFWVYELSSGNTYINAGQEDEIYFNMNNVDPFPVHSYFPVLKDNSSISNTFGVSGRYIMNFIIELWISTGANADLFEPQLIIEINLSTRYILDAQVIYLPANTLSKKITLNGVFTVTATKGENPEIRLYIKNNSANGVLNIPAITQYTLSNGLYTIVKVS